TRRQETHPRNRFGGMAVRGSRKRLGYMEFHGGRLWQSPSRPEHRDGNQEYRNHQAGGNRRTGFELSVRCNHVLQASSCDSWWSSDRAKLIWFAMDWATP